MTRALSGLAHAVAGYGIMAVAGYLLVGQLSGNTHDRSVEAAMTAVFVAGPLGGIIGLAIGLIRGGRGRR